MPVQTRPRAVATKFWPMCHGGQNLLLQKSPPFIILLHMSDSNGLGNTFSRFSSRYHMKIGLFSNKRLQPCPWPCHFLSLQTSSTVSPPTSTAGQLRDVRPSHTSGFRFTKNSTSSHFERHLTGSKGCHFAGFSYLLDFYHTSAVP